MNNRPMVVTIVGLVTLVPTVLILCTFGWLEFILISSVINGGLYSATNWVLIGAVATALEVYALAISISMLVSHAKVVWYSSMIFWISVIATAILFSLWTWSGFIQLAVPPMASSAVCLALFNDKKVKNYFGLSH
jgi:hypothetical protein